MKKRLYKIFIIVLIGLGVISLFGCEKNNSNNENPPPIILPIDKVKAVNDEVIFVTINNFGSVDTIKASNHIDDAKFLMYQTYGEFKDEGHLNITNGEANIMIEGNVANIPSLRAYSDFFYMLNLNELHYNSRLPFDIDISYKLNDILTDYSQIIGESGDIEIILEINSNKNSHAYFQRNFAAQIQIPINIKNSKIIDSDGAMAQVIVGSVQTLAYMVMPGESKVIKLKLKTDNFHFDGIQATYQPFSIMDMADGLIDVKKLGLDQISAMPGAIDLITSQLNGAKNQMSPLFMGLKENLNEINQISSNEQMARFEELITGLNSSDINTVYDLFGNVLAYNTFDIGGNRHVFIKIVNDIKTHTNNLTNYHTGFNSHIQNLVNSHDKNMVFADKYELEFQKFVDNIESFNEIKKSFEKLNQLDITNLENIVKNKGQVIEELISIDTNVELIKVKFNQLISSMYFFPEGFEIIAKDIYGMLDTLSKLFTEIEELTQLFSNLSSKIDEGLANNWFSTIGKNAFTKFNEELKREDDANPGLIQGLQMAIYYINEMNLDEKAEQAKQLLALYEIDDETQMSQIDLIYLGFVEMNKGLQLKQEGQDTSFYDGISKLISIKGFIQLIPTPLDIEIPSFLSEENLPPASVQIIVKQKGF